MKIKYVLASLFLLFPLSIMAQEKELTLQDLIPGGDRIAAGCRRFIEVTGLAAGDQRQTVPEERFGLPPLRGARQLSPRVIGVTSGHFSVLGHFRQFIQALISIHQVSLFDKSSRRVIGIFYGFSLGSRADQLIGGGLEPGGRNDRSDTFLQPPFSCNKGIQFPGCCF